MLLIKEIMLQKDVRRYGLAKKTGLNYHTLINIENGGDVKLSTLKKIADALGVSVKDLIK